MNKRPLVFFSISFLAGALAAGMLPGKAGYIALSCLALSYLAILACTLLKGIFSGGARPPALKCIVVFIVSIALSVAGYVYCAFCWSGHIHRLAGYENSEVAAFGMLAAPFEKKGKFITAELAIHSIAEAGFPEAGFPEAAFPGTGFLEAAYPEAGFPEAGFPGTGFLEAAYPEAAYPEAGFPEAALPGTAYPVAAFPGTASPEAAFPEAGFPVAAFPGGAPAGPNSLAMGAGKLGKPIGRVQLSIDPANSTMSVGQLNNMFKYGDMVLATGFFTKPGMPTSPHQFDSQKHLFSRGLSGTLRCGPGDVRLAHSFTGLSPRRIAYGIRGSIDEIFHKVLPEDDAALMSAVMLSMKDNLGEDARRNFSEAGLMHIMAVSGIHVMVLSIIVIAVLRRANVGIRPARAISVLFVIAYAFVAGLTASIVRAAIMYTFYVWGKTTHKGPDSLTSLGAAALILLAYNPLQCFSASFQLSFAATGSIIVFSDKASALIRRLSLPNTAIAALSTSAAVQIGIIPIQASLFGTISPLSILCNVMIMPLLGAVMALGQALVIIGSVSAVLAYLPALVLVSILRFINGVAYAFSSLPFSTLRVAAPGYMHYALYYIAVFMAFNFDRALWALRNCAGHLRKSASPLRNVKNPLLIAAPAILCSLAALSTAFFLIGNRGGPQTEIVFIDTGHSNASYINVSNKYHLLVDAGARMNYVDMQPIGETKVADYLAGRGVGRIDLAVLTHGDFDHIGGMRAVIDSVSVGAILVSGVYDPELDGLLEYAISKNIDVIKLWSGGAVNIGDAATIEVISPFRDDYDEGGKPYWLSLNESSLVCRLAFGGISALYCGDIGSSTEGLILGRLGPNQNINACIINVPHHGSRNSSSEGFIEAVSPSIAVFEVGRNSYGHPNDGVISNYESAGATILRTDLDGTVTIRGNGKGGFEVSRYNSAENAYPWLSWKWLK